jgi:hypothetical protein
MGLIGLSMFVGIFFRRVFESVDVCRSIFLFV